MAFLSTTEFDRRAGLSQHHRKDWVKYGILPKADRHEGVAGYDDRVLMLVELTRDLIDLGESASAVIRQRFRLFTDTHRMELATFLRDVGLDDGRAWRRGADVPRPNRSRFLLGLYGIRYLVIEPGADESFAGTPNVERLGAAMVVGFREAAARGHDLASYSLWEAMGGLGEGSIVTGGSARDFLRAYLRRELTPADIAAAPAFSGRTQVAAAEFAGHLAIERARARGIKPSVIYTDAARGAAAERGRDGRPLPLTFGVALTILEPSDTPAIVQPAATAMVKPMKTKSTPTSIDVGRARELRRTLGHERASKIT